MWYGGGKIKSRFRSRSEHILDSKGRLSFPSRFREVLRHLESDILMITTWGKYLRAYPVSEWEQLETKLLTDGKAEYGMQNFVRHIVASVTECVPDRQGRILLPPILRHEANLSKEVVLTGMLDWVEIWDKDAYDAVHQATRDNFESYEEKLSKIGIF